MMQKTESVHPTLTGTIVTAADMNAAGKCYNLDSIGYLPL